MRDSWRSRRRQDGLASRRAHRMPAVDPLTGRLGCVTGGVPVPEFERPQRRLALLAGAALLSFAVLAARDLAVQAFAAAALRERYQDQHVRSEQLPPLRGDILDRDGRILATSGPAFGVWADRTELHRGGPGERTRVASGLATALDVPVAEIETLLAPSQGRVPLGRWLSEGIAQQIRELGTNAVHVYPQRRRFYPRAGPGAPPLAASLIGFVDVDEVGISGLELVFDEKLRGRAQAGEYLRVRASTRLQLDSHPTQMRRGASIQLALDRLIQSSAERALAATLENTGAERATLIAMDPRNGDVLALAQQPSFDSNRVGESDPRTHGTFAFHDQFEPGSTLKPFTLAIALESGALRPSDTIDCEQGRYRVGRRFIHDTSPHGVLSVTDVLRVSSNIGFVKIGARVEPARLVGGLRRFGFGHSTQSGFHGEISGTLRDLAPARKLEQATLAFGHGLSVTAAQLAVAASVLANGGQRVRPRLVTHVAGIEQPIVRGERVLSAETAATVREMLTEVVRDGTATRAALSHHRVAGKTGTAQKVVDGRYSHEHYVASFFGMLPVGDPRLVIVVVVDEPKAPHSGGQVAAPVFREVAEAAIRALGIPAEIDP